MKRIIAAALILSASIASSYAAGMMFLHIGTADSQVLGTPFVHSSVQGSTVTGNTSISVTLSPVSTGDILMVYAVINGSSSPTIADTGGNTWNLAGSPVTSTSTANGGLPGTPIIRWAAKANANLANDVITVTNGAATISFATVTAMSVTGANATPFDANVSLPATISGSGTDPIAFSTASSPDLVIACYRSGTQANPTAGNIGGSAATLVVGANFQLCETRLVSAPLGGATATMGVGAGTANGGIVDAIVSNAAVSNSCTGAINLSLGCALAMFGGTL